MLGCEAFRQLASGLQHISSGTGAPRAGVGRGGACERANVQVRSSLRDRGCRACRWAAEGSGSPGPPGGPSPASRRRAVCGPARCGPGACTEVPLGRRVSTRRKEDAEPEGANRTPSTSKVGARAPGRLQGPQPAPGTRRGRGRVASQARAT